MRARIAECRGGVAQAAALVTECLNERPGDQEYLGFAVEVGAILPPRAREIYAERVAAEELVAQAYRDGRVPSDLCRRGVGRGQVEMRGVVVFASPGAIRLGPGPAAR